MPPNGTSEALTRWQPRPAVAALLRAVVVITPIAASVVFVHVASQIIGPPSGSTLQKVAWWVVLSTAATLVLISIDRVTRRLLPLATLLKLALVFPDEAPSRFRTALRAGTTADLERRLERARERTDADTPVEAAERLLEFVAALNTHDRVTRGHSERVRAYAQMIAKELRLGRDEVDRLNWAALLHDIGKLEVPAEVLSKPGLPTAHEWTLIRRHPEAGAQLAEPLRGWLGEWTNAISDHHERWDGNGYPHGTAGDDISLAGRIVAVADVFDVITSARSYKESGTAITAREEIARCAGNQFDPRVVRAFLSISLGRLRLAMGPLSWIAQAPVLGRIPLGPGMATVASSALAVVGALAAGLVGGSHVPTEFAPAASAAGLPRAHVTPAALPVLVPSRRGHGGAARALKLVGLPPTLAVSSASAPPDVVPASRAEQPAAVAPPAGNPPPDSPPVVVPPDNPPVVAPPAEPVNHAPSFSAGADQSVAEDSGAQAVAGWAHAISPGPGDDASQAVSFAVSNDTPSLFTAGGAPSVAPDGTLSYTPAADASGIATVSIQAIDDGGTAYGGSDTSAAQTFRIAVTPVNDAPAFVGGADRTVLENAAPQTVTAWATGISPGPANEAAQTVGFTLSAGNPALFSLGGQPAVTGGGTLTFTPAAGAHGVAIVTVRAVDDGGTAGGGLDTSAPQTFAITVVNQSPVANADTPGVLENDATGVTFNVLANDSDPEADALAVSSYDDSTIANGGLTSNGGGSFTYVPAAHFAGSDTFSYSVTDGNGNTAAATVTITVTAVPDPPATADDSYVTAQGTPLVEPAPGVLANDADSGGGTLVVTTTPVVAPANGALSLAADGSFTYTPGLGFTGSDSFTYQATSLATGLSANAVVTITVPATFNASLLYLTGSGITSEVWDLGTTAPAPSIVVPDYDGDLLPGLTIKSGDGHDTGDARRSQTWRYPLASALALNGPVTLHLSSHHSGGSKGRVFVYLYDCTAGAVSCTQISYGTLTDQNWNGLLSWAQHDISVGTVNRTLPAGHELRLRLYVGDGDQAVAMTAALPSSLTLTTP